MSILFVSMEPEEIEDALWPLPQAICERCLKSPVTCELFIDPRGRDGPVGTYYLCGRCALALEDWLRGEEADE
jgi:hypothetical protein